MDLQEEAQLQIGETVESRLVDQAPFNSHAFYLFLNQVKENPELRSALLERGLAFDYVAPWSEIDEENRRYRRHMGWNVPERNSGLESLAIRIVKDVINQVDKIQHRSLDDSSRHIFEKYAHLRRSGDVRVAIEILLYPPGVEARIYDSVPHIDALNPSKDFPVIECFVAVGGATRTKEGEYIWLDTPPFEYPHEVIAELKDGELQDCELGVGYGPTLLHYAPQTGDSSRLAVRIFLEPLRKELNHDVSTKQQPLTTETIDDLLPGFSR